MRTQALLLAAPSAAMAVVGFALFGPGAVRPFDGARIRGGPTEGQTHLSWRLTVLQRFRGIDSTHDVGAIFVRARANGAEAVAHCRTRSDGTCDVDLSFPAPVSGLVHALVTQEPSGIPLVEGDFTATDALYATPTVHGAHLRGTTNGTLELDVYAKRGIFAAPFRDDLVVVVRHDGAPMLGATVDVRSDAADLDPAPPAKPDAPPTDRDEKRGAIDAESKATATTSIDGRATFGVAPRMHAVDVAIKATALGLEGTWSAVLPVVPGAIWLDPERLQHGKIRVVAPVPREVAYATIATKTARLWGGVIPLSTDARGFASGEIDEPEAATQSLEDRWITLSSDPLASGMGTVGWPVIPPTSLANDKTLSRPLIARDERAFHDQLLLDGLPAAQESDQNRRYRARGLAALALGAAAVLEGVLLAQSSRRGGPRAWGWTAIAIATVALAFAAVGVVVVWKTGT